MNILVLSNCWVVYYNIDITGVCRRNIYEIAFSGTRKYDLQNESIILQLLFALRGRWSLWYYLICSLGNISFRRVERYILGKNEITYSSRRSYPNPFNNNTIEIHLQRGPVNPDSAVDIVRINEVRSKEPYPFKTISNVICPECTMSGLTGVGRARFHCLVIWGSLAMLTFGQK